MYKFNGLFWDACYSESILYFFDTAACLVQPPPAIITRLNNPIDVLCICKANNKQGYIHKYTVCVCRCKCVLSVPSIRQHCVYLLCDTQDSELLSGSLVLDICQSVLAGPSWITLPYAAWHILSHHCGHLWSEKVHCWSSIQSSRL